MQKINQLGIAPLILIAMVVLILIVGLGGYLLMTKPLGPIYNGPLPPYPPAGGVCTQEAKQCPDGSYVGRSGPKCEFAPCPAMKPSATMGISTRSSY